MLSSHASHSAVVLPHTRSAYGTAGADHEGRVAGRSFGAAVAAVLDHPHGWETQIAGASGTSARTTRTTLVLAPSTANPQAQQRVLAAAVAAVVVGASQRGLLRCGGAAARHRLGGQRCAAANDESTGHIDNVRRRFARARSATFFGMVLGYAVYYFTRLSFTYVGLTMRKEMGFSMVQLGAISSLFPLAYMNSKFISGILSDMLGSPVLIFSVGLAITGVLNIAFACGTTIPWFTAIWFLNGLFQGCGATPCNKMLVNWYPAQSRGKWWSGWNASHNIGGFFIPLLAGSVAAAYSWRWGMIVPGVIAIVTGLACFTFMQDSPEKIGLPSAEEHGRVGTAADTETPAEVTREAPDVEESKDEAVWKLLLRNKFLWYMAAMHFFVYFIRQGVLNWAHFYIMDNFGVPAMEATARVSGFELGGLLGCIVSGQVSDWLIGQRPEAGAAGLRTQVMVYYMLLSAASVLGLWLLPPVAALQWLCMCLFGFAIYGPQTLITMTGVETVPRRAAATAGGLLAYPAQFGSICAGLPFALMVQNIGWRGFFPSLVALSILAALVVLPGWNTPSYVQIQKRAAGGKSTRTISS